MNSGPSSVIESYNAQINLEIGNIQAKPLGYDATRLLEILDEFELDPRIHVQDYNENYASIHLLAHIVNLDFVNAKFVAKRLNENLAKNERIQAIVNIVKAVAQKKYEDVLVSARHAEALLGGHQGTKALIEASIPILRFYILRFLTRTFETLELGALSKFLGLNEEETREYVIKNGWKRSEGNFMRAPEKVDISDKDFKQITEAQFKNLSQTISFLETI